MADSALEILQEIATYVASSIAGAWVQANIEIEIDHELANLKLWYTDADGNVGWLDKDAYFAASKELSDQFIRLRAVTADQDKGSWSGATFTLSREGQFSTDFSYDPPSWAR